MSNKCKKSRYDQTKYHIIKSWVEDIVIPHQHYVIIYNKIPISITFNRYYSFTTNFP